jgi:hypothetical protein
MTVRIEPSSARYRVQESFNGISVSIPSRRNWLLVLFLCAWLGAWTMGEASAISEIFHIKIELFGDTFKSRAHPGSQAFLLFWLVGWTIGGVLAFASLVWQLLGREIIGVEAGELVYRVEVLGIRRTRAFATDQIARLRAVDMDSSTGSRRSNWAPAPALFGQGVGSIAFDYGARAYRIGASLDEPEARLLIQQLQRWLPERAVTT